MKMIFPDRPGLGNCSSDSFGFCRLLQACSDCVNICQGADATQLIKFFTLKTQDPTFIDRVAEARLPLAALVLTMNLTVALEVDDDRDHDVDVDGDHNYKCPD